MKILSRGTLLFLLCIGLMRAQETRTDSTATIVSSPWSLERFSQPDIRMQPDRSLTSLLSLVPGITNVNGKLYARGSREGELNYRFGGISVLNRWSNAPGIPFLPEMISGVTAHTGAYGPSMGAESGGVIDMELRDGGDRWSADAAYLSDRFARIGEQFLKTSSFGRTTAVITFGGPLPFESNLFVAAEVSHADNRSPMYLEPMTFHFTQDPYGPRNYMAGTPLPGPLTTQRNFVPGQSSERSVVQFNARSEALGPELRMFGSISSEESKDISWPTAVTNYLRLERVPSIKETATFVALEGSYLVTDAVRLVVQGSYYDRQAGVWDPDFGDNWKIFADSAANASAGYTGFQSRYVAPSYWTTIIMFVMNDPFGPNNSFWKERQSKKAVSVQADMQLTPMWEMHLSGESEWWVLRKFSVRNISFLRSILDVNRDGSDDQTFSSDLKKRETWKRFGVRNIGYSLEGDELNDGFDAARRPMFAAINVDNRVIDDRTTLRIGVRAQLISNNIPTWDPGVQPNIDGSLGPMYTEPFGFIDESALHSSSIEKYLLPRGSLEYRGDWFSLFMAAGSYVDIMPQNQLHIDEFHLSDLLYESYRVQYNYGSEVLTFPVRSARTEQTEAGMEVRLNDVLSVSSRVHYKHMKNQVRLGLVTLHPLLLPYPSFVNTGESTSLGVEIGLAFHSNMGASLDLNAGIARQQGNGSSPRSNQQEVTDGPVLLPAALLPLEYQRELQLRAKFAFIAPEGSGFEGLQFMAQAYALNGVPFTKELEEPIYAGGFSTPWTVGVKSLIDVRARIPVEPYYTSRTPWVTGIDISLAYEAKVGPVTATFYALAKNILDTRNVVNVYLTTGSASSDGWLESSTEQFYEQFTGYEDYYNQLNNVNRWAYVQATGNDLYGQPRQLQFGVKVGI